MKLNLYFTEINKFWSTHTTVIKRAEIIIEKLICRVIISENSQQTNNNGEPIDCLYYFTEAQYQ
jgi:hypothetical protein